MAVLLNIRDDGVLTFLHSPFKNATLSPSLDYIDHLLHR